MSSKNPLASVSRDVTPKNVQIQNCPNLKKSNYEIFCFFRGFEQLSCSISRQVVTGQIQDFAVQGKSPSCWSYRDETVYIENVVLTTARLPQARVSSHLVRMVHRTSLPIQIICPSVTTLPL